MLMLWFVFLLCEGLSSYLYLTTFLDMFSLFSSHHEILIAHIYGISVYILYVYCALHIKRVRLLSSLKNHFLQAPKWYHRQWEYVEEMGNQRLNLICILIVYLKAKHLFWITKPQSLDYYNPNSTVIFGYLKAKLILQLYRPQYLIRSFRVYGPNFVPHPNS